MYLDTLSTTVFRLCKQNKWTYKTAGDHCTLSPSCMGNIAHGKTVPSIHTLEKLCSGFRLLPNDLLIAPSYTRELTYRIPMRVTHRLGHKGYFGITFYSVCPQCHCTLEREYQLFCDRCGQKLSWEDLSQAELILPE